MKILKNKIFWFTIYGIFITLVFLYLLFPSDIAQSRLEESIASSGLILKTGSLKPSLPLGLKMKNVRLGSGSSPNIYFQGDSLDVQFHPLNFFRDKKNIRLSGKAYGGTFSGNFKTTAAGFHPPEEGMLKFKNIALDRYTLIKALTGKQITGKASGNWAQAAGSGGRENSSATISLFLNKGSYPLAEPFLGLQRIDFDRGEIQARLENRVLKFEKFQIFSPQMDCSLNGDIMLVDEFKNSPVNLTGEIIISGRKVKMNVTIEGTIANPSIRYM